MPRTAARQMTDHQLIALLRVHLSALDPRDPMYAIPQRHRTPVVLRARELVDELQLRLEHPRLWP